MKLHKRQNETPSSVAEVEIPSGAVWLGGELALPPKVSGLVLFAHGSGSSRHSPRNQYVARVLRESGIGTLLFDLLTPGEEAIDDRTGHLRFDIALLADRLVDATKWAVSRPETKDLALGYFGASTGGAAALVAAAKSDTFINAVVSRGGRPDLAGVALSGVKAPTLLIVGGRDKVVIELNQKAYERLRCEKELKMITGATHLFEERGALEEVARLAAEWFQRHLKARRTSNRNEVRSLSERGSD
jgi:alpha-beta hydrolase superfamily lysophospholipase